MEVTLDDGTKTQCEDEPFSQGAEGAAYWTKDRRHVVKLYFKPDAARRAAVENIVKRFNLVREDPVRAPFFAWPDGIVLKAAGSDALGVRMPAIVDARPLDQYLWPNSWQNLPPAERGSWATRVSVAFRLARILRWMHNRGLCHSDLSPNNIFADLNTGQTTLIDCDGLVVPNLHPPSVVGTRGCMAPELVTGRAEPSINTDRHALAVLIYWTLLLRNPFRGPKVHHPDAETDENLSLGERALYIEHPSDPSNRPRDFPFSSVLLTPKMQELFRRAFVDHLHRPSDRPLPSEWENALLRMADQVVQCSNSRCLMKAFVAPEQHGFQCPWCGEPFRSGAANLPLLRLYRPGARKGAFVHDDWSVLGGHALCAHHVDLRKAPEPGSPPAVVAYFHADSSGQWSLVNQGLPGLLVLGPTGSLPVAPGTAVPLAPGAKVVFGPEDHYRVGTVDFLQTA